MSEIRKALLYTKDHEWLKRTEKTNVVRVGVTDFAQSSLGDVTFVQMPAVGKTFKKGDTFGTVESVKAVSDLYAPVSGKVSKINEALNRDPAPINTNPFDAGWIIEIEMSDEGELKSLLNAQAYEAVAQ